MSNVSESLRLLTKNERPWGIRSGRSEEMSDHERIAHSLIFGQKMSHSLGKTMSEFPALFLSPLNGQICFWPGQRKNQNFYKFLALTQTKDHHFFQGQPLKIFF